MKPQPALLPPRCDVLVVGAGPAGSAAATELARAGLDVLLVDQHDFPRDKVCGDALIPDAHRALDALGVLPAVLAQARRLAQVRCTGPRGASVEVPGTLAVLPRRELDSLLARHAVGAGATLATPWRYMGPLESGGRVVGARLQHGVSEYSLACRWLVLASGAAPQALLATQMCERQTPSGVALRGYLRHEALGARADALDLVWQRGLRPGYGWVFPAPGGLFNIGVGIVDSHAARRNGRLVKSEGNLRTLLDTFVQAHPLARELVAGGEWVAPPRGAPLRCTLEGARRARPGVLVAGEAAGSTYSLTGEGIGKALETGRLAAAAIAAGGDDDAVCARYASALAALKPRFDLYAQANRVNRRPWLADLLIWRARRSPRALGRLQAVLDETGNPAELASVGGLLRLLTQ